MRDKIFKDCQIAFSQKMINDKRRKEAVKALDELINGF